MTLPPRVRSGWTGPVPNCSAIFELVAHWKEVWRMGVALQCPKASFSILNSPEESAMRLKTTCLCLALPALAWAIQLSPEIQADRYLVRAERKIEEQDFVVAKESLDRILELQEQHDIEVRSEFSAMYARVALGLGLHAEAIESATRYLTLGGREGEHYRTALELLDRAEEEKVTAEAEARRAEARSRAVRQAVDGMEFVWIPAGEFLMGSEREDVTRVRISQGFWLGKHEVTQAEWETFMGENPSHFDGCGPDCPVENVSWHDAQRFVERLNLLSSEYSDGTEYRLPTEAEWEYAARAGMSGDRYSDDLDAIAWYDGNSGDRSHAVGRKEPNVWGAARHAGERERVGTGLAR